MLVGYFLESADVEITRKSVYSTLNETVSEKFLAFSLLRLQGMDRFVTLETVEKLLSRSDSF